MKIVERSVSIIGCGWLGLAFAKKMVAKGWKVKASTTKKSKLTTLQNYGIESKVLQFPAKNKLDSTLFQADYLLISFPPGRQNKETLASYHSSIKQITEAERKTAQIKKIVFISSTSVYEKKSDKIDEFSITKPTSPSGQAILNAEKIIIESNVPSVILRFGGLAGPHRHPGKFLAGKNNLPNGNQSINYLHLEDAVGVIAYMMEHSIENEIFNVVSPIHYSKNEFYSYMSKSIDLPPPEFSVTSSNFKAEISTTKLLKETDFKFIYPDPMKFKY